MTKLTSTPAGAVLVAIDMSKSRQEVLIERPEGGRRRRMTVMATRQDYDGFAEQLAAIGRPIIVGFEATGNYHRTLAHRLLTAGFELRLISSVALARTREALHNGWDKNDSKDAQVILHMLRIGATQRYVDPLVAGINDLQELSKTHETISRMKTQTWHRILTHYLPLYFPEIARFAGNSRSDWFLALIERFPTPATITALDREAFSAAAWPLIGRKVSKARLINDIYETASASTALPVPENSAAITMFRMVIAQGRSLIHQRDEIERLAHARLADDVDYQLLRNIPGIGPINALTILAEAGDLRRFNHHRQFLKFCGLDLATCQSGTFRGRTKLSKYGNARLRRTFWMAAQVAARQRDNSFRDKLGRYVAGHADDADRRRKAMTALTAKMARVAHAVIKTGTEYRPFLERSDARWKDPSLQVP
ncbi:IS110 family transposase [Sphingomonas sp. ABOLG]|jgi:transposase|uniref:Transposase n=2 Tax=Pseudomonadota TaxID=1224 RepID=A0A7W6ADC4_9SPHN|nr:transposase [Sphingomonas pseudosanguinis]MBM3929375.1 IS110 family transposase [Sphingomonadales bacterium]MBN2971188.1 IS110 family transposase [Roseomonas aeriglobus]MDG5973286.1 IS110 family transposase [Sphingomonas paucimobilis]RSV17328.1 IS110 family transposase [Sphingomonas sp. ABOLG]RSV19065.1 IS110 family transposase [Sphingomonas sp. ABOLH]